MKRILSLLLAVLLIFSGCAAGEKISQTPTESESLAQAPGDVANAAYESRFDSEMLITLSDAGVETNAPGVFASNDIIYYEDRDAYDSGYPYGEGEGWERVCAAVAQTWPEAVLSPYLMIQCADARHWGAVSDRVYRFSAMDLTAEERRTIHGHNERIRLSCLHRAVEFYLRLLTQC